MQTRIVDQDCQVADRMTTFLATLFDDRVPTTSTIHPFNGLFSRTTWVSRYQRGKTSLDLNEARDDGVLGCSDISWTICKQSAPRSRQVTTPTPHHAYLIQQIRKKKFISRSTNFRSLHLSAPVTVATGRIAIAQVNPSYSPGGANVYSIK